MGRPPQTDWQSNFWRDFQRNNPQVALPQAPAAPAPMAPQIGVDRSAPYIQHLRQAAAQGQQASLADLPGYRTNLRSPKR
jgi:hypothetical protein